jgi:hypothetical protein
MRSRRRPVNRGPAASWPMPPATTGAACRRLTAGMWSSRTALGTIYIRWDNEQRVGIINRDTALIRAATESVSADHTRRVRFRHCQVRRTRQRGLCPNAVVACGPGSSRGWSSLSARAAGRHD